MNLVKQLRLNKLLGRVRGRLMVHGIKVREVGGLFCTLQDAKGR